MLYYYIILYYIIYYYVLISPRSGHRVRPHGRGAHPQRFGRAEEERLLRLLDEVQELPPQPHHRLHLHG